jgi:hypothetical protein
LTTWLPGSHSTIKEWLVRQYEAANDQVKFELGKARSKIHLRCDLWSSPNSIAILGCIAHYITEDGDLRQKVLSLKNIDGQHTGEVLSESMMEVIEDYGIASKVGYLVIYNASNNDKIMEHLSIGKHLLL